MNYKEFEKLKESKEVRDKIYLFWVEERRRIAAKMAAELISIGKGYSNSEVIRRADSLVNELRRKEETDNYIYDLWIKNFILNQ